MLFRKAILSMVSVEIVVAMSTRWQIKLQYLSIKAKRAAVGP